MSVNIQNPGSALGEAIGSEMEKALNRFLIRVSETAGYHLISKGLGKAKSGREKKLLMYDKFGTAYNIDSVIANHAMQPVILVESKYIRYTKHNRDKGSWICTAHPALRKRYPSIRSSIAVLAGNWSKSSQAMMKSNDINIFLVKFDAICNLLAEHRIAFDWDEKDRSLATEAWAKYSRLTKAQKAAIGAAMANQVKDDLERTILTILDDSIPRKVNRVTVELHSNLGEVKVYEFETVDEAVEFLNSNELSESFLSTDSPSLFDSSPESESLD